MQHLCAGKRQRTCTQAPAGLAYGSSSVPDSAVPCEALVGAALRCVWTAQHRTMRSASLCCSEKWVRTARRIVEPVWQQRGSGAHHVDHGRNGQAHEACGWQADVSVRSGARLSCRLDEFAPRAACRTRAGLLRRWAGRQLAIMRRQESGPGNALPRWCVCVCACMRGSRDACRVRATFGG